MIFRFLFALLLTLGLGAKSWACSCAPWSGNVSDFTKSYISVWAVSIEAKVEIEDAGKASSGVTYRLDILEGYNRVAQAKIDVKSSLPDGGGSCGVELPLGRAQFISAYQYDIGKYGTSSCTPQLPYEVVKRYLETGEDSFIPEWLTCHSWPSGSTYSDTPVFNEALEECAVWKNADHIAGFMGAKDQRKYSKIWWDKIESTKPKKKTRSWWPFKKD